MSRRKALSVTVAITVVLMAGCTGAFSSQGTATETSISTANSTETATSAETSAETVSGTSASIGNTSIITGSIVQSGGTFTKGETTPVRLQIINYEGRQVNYTTVIQLVRFNVTGPDATATERQTLDRFTTIRRAGEGSNQTITRTIAPNITANATGEALLLGFYLYKSNPPAKPTFDNAYKYSRFEVNVTNSSQGESTAGAPTTIQNTTTATVTTATS
jgi:hypothetical protein